MSDSLVAKRYAKALFEVGAQKGAAAEVDGDVATAAQALAASRDLRLLFQSPIVSREKKAAVLESLFANRVGQTMLDFLKLLVAKGRENIFSAIAEAYQALRDEQSGVVAAHARAAFSMSPDSESKLRQMLESKTGKKVRLHVDVEPALVGGVVVRVGDTVYDGSVSNRLSRLKEKFA